MLHEILGKGYPSISALRAGFQASILLTIYYQPMLLALDLHTSLIDFTLLQLEMSFSSFLDIGDLIRPIPCNAIFTIDITRSTGLFHEWYGGVWTAISI